MAFFERLLNTSMYSPHGICLLWEPELIWLHVVSDALIALAYFSIPFVLAFFVSKRRDVMFGWVFWAFAIFITACGVTRLMSIYTLWVPAYGIEGITKAVPALISVVTAAMLWLLLPRLLVLPTRIQLQQAYAALEEEVRQRRSAEAMVQRFQEIEATEAQVRQAQKMEAIGQLTGGVAHDFNNILTVITGTIEILGDAVKDRPHLAQITNMISAAAARGADLTQHLLAFARRQPLQPRSDRRQRPGRRCRAAAAADARRTDRNRIDAGARCRAGPDRSQPALDRDPEPRPECARRHAGRRQADAGNQERRARRGLRRA